MGRVNLLRDPALLEVRKRRLLHEALFLGLDLGSSTGVAFCYHKNNVPLEPEKLRLYLGQWSLDAGAYDSGALRFARLRQFLTALSPDAVFFEDVRYTPPNVPGMSPRAMLARAATSSEFFGALKATVCTWCEEADVVCGSFPIQHIKKRATNKGNSGKPEVIKACNELFHADLSVTDYESTGADNIADASFCLLLGMEMYAEGVLPQSSLSQDPV